MIKNELMKLVASRMNRYKIDGFCKKTRIDMHRAEPILIDAEAFVFNKKTNEKDMFIFLDSDNNIVGITIGSKRNDDLSIYESADKRLGIKSLASKASSVLMFTPEMRSYVPDAVRNKRPAKIEYREYRRLLRKRLEEYKEKKYNATNHQQILCYAQVVVNRLAFAMFNSQEDKYVDFMKTKECFCDNPERLMQQFVKRVEELKRCHKEMRTNFYSKEYYQAEYNKYKIEILNWYNKLNEINNEQVAS